MLHTFKLDFYKLKIGLINLLKVCSVITQKIYELQKKMFYLKDQKVKIHSECFLDELLSQPESKLHRATSPLLKPALLCH